MASKFGIVSRIKDLFSKNSSISEAEHKTIEKILYEADFSHDIVCQLMNGIKGAKNIDEASNIISRELLDIFRPYQREPELNNKPSVIMMVGVNGTGKTTACAKLAKRLKSDGNRVMLSAGDTFRAAAVEQLEHWAKKTGAEFFSKAQGADPGAVAFESVNKAKETGMDVLILDTGGRIHTQSGLMAEIQKVHKAVAKALDRKPDHVMLVVDSTQGQNIQNQVSMFDDFVDISGIILSKFDGSAKGGALLSALKKLDKPVFFISSGETLDSFELFNAQSFVSKVLQN